MELGVATMGCYKRVSYNMWKRQHLVMMCNDGWMMTRSDKEIDDILGI